METKEQKVTLTWCRKHKNWWVTNCPDCMVDYNEPFIKKAERERIIPLIIQYSRAEISIDTLLKKIKGGE